LEQIEAEKRRREEAERRTQREEREAQERYRAALEKDLTEMAQRWTHARELRAFLGAVAKKVPPTQRSDGFEAWLRWAQERASKLDPLLEPQRIAKVVTPTAATSEPAAAAQVEGS
jgi:hypothetical protein